VDTRTGRGPPPGLPPIPRLHRHLAIFGCWLVRHGNFVGVTGEDVGQVPQCLWAEIDRHERRLLRLLRDSPGPWRGRG
jgi:hypothetical protein